MSQLKPGEPALVVGGSAFLGMEVTLIAFIRSGDTWTNSKGMTFEFELESGKTGWVVGRDKTATLKRPEWLIPLRDDFEPEQQRATELTT